MRKNNYLFIDQDYIQAYQFIFSFYINGIPNACQPHFYNPIIFVQMKLIQQTVLHPPGPARQKKNIKKKSAKGKERSLIAKQM